MAPRDRLILRMRFEDDFGAADIARALALDEKVLSRRIQQFAAPGAGGEAPVVSIRADVGRGFDRDRNLGRERPAARDAAADGGCLDAERLARLLEGRVNAAERERVEAHLAGCARCYDVFVEAIRLLACLADDPEVRLAARRGRRGRGATIAGAGLAVAAAVWKLTAPPATVRPGDSRRARPRPKS